MSIPAVQVTLGTRSGFHMGGGGEGGHVSIGYLQCTCTSLHVNIMKHSLKNISMIDTYLLKMGLKCSQISLSGMSPHPTRNSSI